MTRLQLKHLGMVFAVAFSIRVVFVVVVLLSCPEFIEHPSIDGAFYVDWARDILANEGQAKQAFFAHPLYPHVLAALFAVVGVHPVAVVVLQIVLGAATCVLVYDIGRRIFSEEAGVLAGLLLAVFWPSVANVALLETVELGNFLFAVSLWFWLRGNHKVPSSIMAGLALGWSTLCRANLLFLVPAFIAHGWRQRRLSVFAFVLGTGLVLGLVGARNRWVAGQWLFTTGHGGIALYMGFAPHNLSGTYESPSFVRPEPRYEQLDFQHEAERRVGHVLTTAESSSFWRGETLAEMGRSFADTGIRIIRKFGLTLANYEIADNNSLPYLRDVTGFSFVPLPGYGLILVLAVLGFGAAWPHERGARLLGLLAATYVATLLLFFVSSRMRAPLWVIWAPLAGRGLCEIRSWTLRAWPKGALALMLTLVFWFMAPPALSARDEGQALAMHAVALMKANRLDDAQSVQLQALAKAPNNAFILANAGALALARDEARIAAGFCQRAVSLRPNVPGGQSCLGLAAAQLGMLEQARMHLAIAARDRTDVPARLNYAIVLGRLGNNEAATAEIRKLSADAPRDARVQAAVRLLPTGRE